MYCEDVAAEATALSFRICRQRPGPLLKTGVADRGRYARANRGPRSVRRQARRLGAKAARRASTGKHEAAVRSAGRFSKSGTCAQAEGDRDPRSPVKEKVDSYKKPDHPES